MFEGKKDIVAQASLIVVTHLSTGLFTHSVLGKVTARSTWPHSHGADHCKKYNANVLHVYNIIR